MIATENEGERKMSIPKIGYPTSSVAVEQTRSRETPPPSSAFSNILHGGANVLISGAKAASSFVGGPLLSAAVAKVGADPVAGSTAPTTEISSSKSLVQQQISDDLQLLALQQEIQKHDRQFSLISNVMKARHDTAKSAIGNIRS
jgi:hypothetical protein